MPFPWRYLGREKFMRIFCISKVWVVATDLKSLHFLYIIQFVILHILSSPSFSGLAFGTSTRIFALLGII